MTLPEPEPAKYTKGYDSEYDAVQCLQSLLDVKTFKTYLAKGDRIPNYDGHIELTDDNGAPIGKLEVQVRHHLLPKKKAPTYHFDSSLLAYGKVCSLPFILILVDPIQKKAHWEYLSWSRCDSLIKSRVVSDGISDTLPKLNIISDAYKDYVEHWKTICKNHLNVLTSHDTISKELELVRKTLSKYNSAIGKSNPHFKEIHSFLDFYNGLLDREFLALKVTEYYGIWKIGLAFSLYEATRAQYIFYGIDYETNEVQIKQVDDSELDEIAETIISYNNQNEINPIRSTPEAYSYSLIRDKLLKIFELKNLLFVNKSIADESLTRFIQDQHTILGLSSLESQYLVSDVNERLNEYIYIWIDEAVNLLGITKYSQTNQIPVVLERFIQEHRINSETIDIIIKRASERFKNGEYSNKKILIGSAKYNLSYMGYLLHSKKEKNDLFIDRIYLPINQTNFRENLRENVKKLYESIPAVITEFIHQFFPLLSTQISYYANFNKLVIVLDPDGQFNFPVTYCYLSTDGDMTNINPVEVVYIDELDIASTNKSHGEVLKDILKKGLTINNITHKCVGINQSSSSFDFSEIPLWNLFYYYLTKLFKDYFEKKCKTT